MSEEFKKQHIVSRVYLKRFAEHKNGKELIGVRLKKRGNHPVQLFSNSTYNVGYIQNYYDTLQKEEPKFWEHYMDKNFDVLCGVPLERIVARITLTRQGEKALSPEDKVILSKIIISQMIRVPPYLDKQIIWADTFIQQYKQEFVESIPKGNEEIANMIQNFDFDCDARKNLILDSLFDEKRFSRFCQALLGRVWMVFYNGNANVYPYMTSDNPALIKNMRTNEVGLGTNGIASDTSVILYPITPKILIAIYSPNMFFGVHRAMDSCKYVISDDRFTIAFNNDIMNSCYLQAFVPPGLYRQVNPADKKFA